MLPREAAMGLTLARGVLSGAWTLEQIDECTIAWSQTETDRVRSARPVNPCRYGNTCHGAPTMRYLDAGFRRSPRNLAREWMAAYPQEWAALQEGSDPLNVGGLGNQRSRKAAYVGATAVDSAPPGLELLQTVDFPDVL